MSNMDIATERLASLANGNSASSSFNVASAPCASCFVGKSGISGIAGGENNMKPVLGSYPSDVSKLPFGRIVGVQITPVSVGNRHSPTMPASCLTTAIGGSSGRSRLYG